MEAGELLISPISPRTLYASNRGQVDLNSSVEELHQVTGDAIAILTLSSKGDEVENIEWIQTGTNFIRGMGITNDGKYLGTVGQKDGNVEVYEVKGERGEKLELVARLEGGVSMPTDFQWI